MKIGRPTAEEAEAYYFRYIDQVAEDDPVFALQQQFDTVFPRLTDVSETESLYRYADDKWSMRGVLNHINDGERLFSSRAFWFARGFADPLPSFEQTIAAAKAEADRVNWSAQVEELRRIRLSTLSLFQNLPPAAWSRAGVASGYRFTVRALAFIIAGHFAHHFSILEQRYLANEAPSAAEMRAPGGAPSR